MVFQNNNGNASFPMTGRTVLASFKENLESMDFNHLPDSDTSDTNAMSRQMQGRGPKSHWHGSATDFEDRNYPVDCS